MARLTRYFAFAALVLAGCSGTPSEAEARRTLEDKIQKQSAGLIRLVSFQKTDGMTQEFAGMKGYHMEYTAEIEFLDDCMWSAGAFMWEGNFFAKRGHSTSGMAGFMDLSQGFKPARKGDRHRFSGSFDYVKTERGWRL